MAGREIELVDVSIEVCFLDVSIQSHCRNNKISSALFSDVYMSILSPESTTSYWAIRQRRHDDDCRSGGIATRIASTEQHDGKEEMYIENKRIRERDSRFHLSPASRELYVLGHCALEANPTASDVITRKYVPSQPIQLTSTHHFTTNTRQTHNSFLCDALS